MYITINILYSHFILVVVELTLILFGSSLSLLTFQRPLGEMEKEYSLKGMPIRDITITNMTKPYDKQKLYVVIG